MSAFVWNEKESRKKRATRKREEREAEAKEAEALRDSLLASSGVDLGPLPSSLSGLGKCEQRIAIPEGCSGILIGKKGENLKSVEKRFKVTVRIEDENAEKDAAEGKRRVGPLKGTKLQVVVSGDSRGAVAAAARELDFAVDFVEIASEMVGWAVGRGGKHLTKIKELSNVAVLNMDRGDRTKRANKEDQENEERDVDCEAAPENEAEAEGGEEKEVLPEKVKFEIRGQRDAVADARLLLEAHLGYYPVYQQMQEAEEELNQDILEAQGKIGRTTRRPAGGGGGRGRGRGAASGKVGGRGRGNEENDATTGKGGGSGRGGRIWARAQKSTDVES